MKRKNILIYFIWILLLSSSCINSGKPKNLYGEWKYIQLEHPNNPSDSISAEELAGMAPLISFSEKGDMVIIWGGKKLSEGKFSLEGNLIRITEILPGGKIRSFPFSILELRQYPGI